MVDSVGSYDASSGGVQGSVPSVSESVNEWLAQHGIKDLSGLTQDQLNDLIAFLQTKAGTQPSDEYGKTIRELESIKATWSQNTKGLSPVDAKLHELNAKKAMLDVLIKSAPSDQNLVALRGDLEAKIGALEKCKKSLDLTTVSWNSDASQVNSQVSAQIDAIDALEKSGVDIKALGLDTLRQTLKDAKTKYEAECEKIDKSDKNPAEKEKDKKLALSQYRMELSQAKLDFYKKTGVSDSDPCVVAEKKVLEAEKIWYSNEKTSWTNKDPKSREITVSKALSYDKQGLVDLKEKLIEEKKQAAARGDFELEKLIDAKIVILDRAINQLGPNMEAGKELAITTNCWVELTTVDIEGKRIAAAKVRASDPELANKLEAEAKMLEELIRVVLDQLNKLLDLRANSWAKAGSS